MLPNKNMSTFQMRRISPFRSSNKSKTLPASQTPLKPFRNTNVIPNLQLESHQKQRVSAVMKTSSRNLEGNFLIENSEKASRDNFRHSRLSFNKKILPPFKGTFFHERIRSKDLPLKIIRNKFMYYISEALKGLEKYSQ